MQEEFCRRIWFDPFIICWNPSQDVNESNSIPSVVLMSSDHQEENLTLTSPSKSGYVSDKQIKLCL